MAMTFTSLLGCVLVEDDRIAAVGVALDASEAHEISAQGKIVMPGLINAHIHTWQTALRGIGCNWAGNDYFDILHAQIAPRYTAEDTYIGTLLGMLSQLHGGVTTVFDWCHNNTTPVHSDAAIDALLRSGGRAVFGHGTVKPKPAPGQPHFSRIPHPASEIARLRKDRLGSDDALVTLAMCILGPDYSTLEVNLHDFRLAREHDLLSSAHVWGKANRLVPRGYRTIAEHGLLGPDHNVVRANYIEDDEVQLLVDCGASVTSTPAAELDSTGDEMLAGRVRDCGGWPSIGVDSEMSNSGDMFETMRLAIDSQRCADNGRVLAKRIAEREAAGTRVELEKAAPVGTSGSLIDSTSVTAHEVLAWATINNARALRLDHRIGSLTPGKQADLIVVDTGSLHTWPAAEPVQTLVHFCNASNVDQVLVAGKTVKQAGRLSIDERELASVRNQAAESAARLLEAT